MDGELTYLILDAAVGAALLLLGSLAAVGTRRTLALTRGLGLAGALLALFVGVATDGLSRSLVETPPYATFFLPTNDLRTQALMEDDDLRSRTNVDSRLRYIPSDGERVINLEAPYRLDAGPFRTLGFPAVRHETLARFPRGVEPMGDAGDPTALRAEVAGLYEAARAVAGPASGDARANFLRAASVGFVVVGMVGLLAGLLPLIGRALGLGRDAIRLARATAHRSYRGARGRAIRAGSSALVRWHFDTVRPFASLAATGLLAVLGGVLLGVLREEEVRRAAHETFAMARHMRIEGRGKG